MIEHNLLLYQEKTFQYYFILLFPQLQNIFLFLIEIFVIQKL